MRNAGAPSQSLDGRGLEDANLRLSFRQGNRSALERVYHAYVDEVAALVRRGFVYDRTKRIEVAGITDRQTQVDLVQETFVRAFSESARMSYDGLSPYRPYLLRITKNLMIDRLRHQSRETTESKGCSTQGVGDIDELLDRDLPFCIETPSEQAHGYRQQQAVVQFAESLQEPLRGFYELRYQQELSHEAVASRMGVTRRRVRGWEEEVREKLKAYLQACGLWP